MEKFIGEREIKMKFVRSLLIGSVCCAVFALMSAAQAGDAPEAAKPFDAKTAFEKLKSLAGDWEGTAGMDGAKHTPADQYDKKLHVNYRVAANGSTVIETYNAGETNEMISVFHMDGPDKLMMTHYCALKNQPQMKFEATDKPNEMKWVFAGGTNFDPEKDLHVHEGTVKFLAKDKIESAFCGFNGGKKVSTNSFTLSRVSK